MCLCMGLPMYIPHKLVSTLFSWIQQRILADLANCICQRVMATKYVFRTLVMPEQFLTYSQTVYPQTLLMNSCLDFSKTSG